MWSSSGKNISYEDAKSNAEMAKKDIKIVSVTFYIFFYFSLSIQIIELCKKFCTSLHGSLFIHPSILPILTVCLSIPSSPSHTLLQITQLPTHFYSPCALRCYQDTLCYYLSLKPSTGHFLVLSPIP